MSKALIGLMVVVATIALAACGGGGGGGGGASGDGPPARVRAALTQTTGCDDLREAVRADARAKVRVQAAALRANGWFTARDIIFGVPGTPVPQPTGAPPGAGEAPTDGPGSFTDTNVQVPGVDEPDVVETDGTHLYLLNGSELLVLDAFPPAATALAARVAIEGFPSGMFVAGGRAAVISTVVDDGTLGGGDACSGVGPPFPTPVLATGAPGEPARCHATFTKLTLIDLAGSPRVVRELYLEGYYVAARRHGGQVRMIVGTSWGAPTDLPDPWVTLWSLQAPGSEHELLVRIDAWEDAALAVIDASESADWLPVGRERRGGALVDVVFPCEGVGIPPPGLTQQGATRVVSVDMSVDASALADTLVVGGASQVYASGDTLVLAQPEWVAREGDAGGDRTVLHVFDLPATSPETIYRASGAVPGIPLSQFAFDVRAGVLRVATTIGTLGVNRVTTARVEGETLAVLGTTGDLAPDERITGVRFLGDRAYLVTFRQVDPLFVIDLTDPARPRVLGEVELPGFSEYLHPLGADHLLTVGQDADEQGFARGAALRIFDVAEPLAPRLTHVEILPGRGWSTAGTNHLVFTFDAARGLLALPYDRFDPTFRSSLLVLGVDVAAGFARRGEIEHTPLDDECPPSHGPFAEPDSPICLPPRMQRGLVIDDFIFSISTGAVVVNALDDLATPVAEVRLPQG